MYFPVVRSRVDADLDLLRLLDLIDFQKALDFLAKLFGYGNNQDLLFPSFGYWRPLNILYWPIQCVELVWEICAFVLMERDVSQLLNNENYPHFKNLYTEEELDQEGRQREKEGKKQSYEDNKIERKLDVSWYGLP